MKKLFIFICILISFQIGYAQDITVEDIKIPMEIKSFFSSKTINLTAKLYKPNSEGKFPLVIINHGTPRNVYDTRNLKAVFKNQSEIFAKKGFVVVVPSRRGYGESEGSFVEGSGSRNNPDYYYSTMEAVKDIKVVVEYMKKQPFIDPSKVLLVGQSAGGFASLAFASLYSNEILGVINFAGGRGSTGPNEIGDPAKLILTMKEFGKTSKAPTLWLYTEDDDFFSPSIAQDMFEEYKKSGGIGKLFILPSGLGGHRFFMQGIKTWGPMVDEFLKEIKLINLMPVIADNNGTNGGLKTHGFVCAAHFICSLRADGEGI